MSTACRTIRYRDPYTGSAWNSFGSGSSRSNTNLMLGWGSAAQGFIVPHWHIPRGMLPKLCNAWGHRLTSPMDHLTWKLQGSDFSALLSLQYPVYYPEQVWIPRERLKPPPIQAVHEIPQIRRPHASYHCYRASWDRSCTHPLLRFFLIAYNIYWPAQTMMEWYSVGLLKHIWSRTRPEIQFAL